MTPNERAFFYNRNLSNYLETPKALIKGRISKAVDAFDHGLSGGNLIKTIEVQVASIDELMNVGDTMANNLVKEALGELELTDEFYILYFAREGDVMRLVLKYSKATY